MIVHHDATRPMDRYNLIDNILLLIVGASSITRIIMSMIGAGAKQKQARIPVGARCHRSAIQET